MEQVDTLHECVSEKKDSIEIKDEPISAEYKEENVVKVSNLSKNEKELQSICNTVLSDTVSKVERLAQTDTKNLKIKEEEAEKNVIKNSNEESLKKRNNNLSEPLQNTNTEITSMKNTNDKCTEKCSNTEPNDSLSEEETVKINDQSELISVVQCNSTKTSIISDVTTENDIKNKQSTVCTMLDISESESANISSDELLDSLSHVSDEKEHSLHETVKQINKDDDNQNNSIVTDAELSKLVEEGSEVVVLTVETIPILSDSTEENITPTVLEEKTGRIYCNEQNLILNKESETKDSKNDDFELIDYDEEGNSTVIEVISTEIVQSQNTETCISDVKSDSVTENKTLKDTMDENIHNNEDLQNNSSKEVLQNNSNTEEQDVLSMDGKIKITKRESISRNDNDIVLVHEKKAENEKSETVSKRSVIQDIFDDWGVENPEEENQSNPKVQDSVEIELKSLLDDSKSTETIDKTVLLTRQKLFLNDNKSITSVSRNDVLSVDNIREKNVKNIVIDQEQVQKKVPISPEIPASSIMQDKLTHSLSQSLGKSVRSVTQDSVLSHRTVQCNTIPVKNRNRHLTSQIVSPAEVTEVLKERLREKQKIVEAPRGPDIFFVKKLTQRLSSKLAGGSVSSMPALIPLPHPTQPTTDNFNKKDTESISVQSTKEENSDNKELLAILEGDVDPDWSNLKPPTLVDEGKATVNIEHNELSTPPKLDPSVERELALKQLLELPVTPLRKNTSNKRKKTFKSGLTKISKSVEKEIIVPENETKEVVNIDLINEDITSKSSETTTEIDITHTIVHEDIQQRCQDTSGQDVRSDESRSGRKRKPTEKAREHEQNTTKRQKVYKGKVSLPKKSETEQDVIVANSLNKNQLQLTTDNTVLPTNTDTKPEDTVTKEVTNKQFTNKIDTILQKPENSPVKRPKQSLTKKGSQPIAKRKMVVKKLMRQKITPNKKPVNLKTKLNAASKKSNSKIVTKSQKRPIDSTTGDVKPKKKIINEIDRLLQDEGVVNLLYDVEQPDKKRLVPITKSQAKVMDLQKVQRELKIRKKLVRNAVLRLRTSTPGITKVSPRSTRTTVHSNESRTDQKTNEQSKVVKASNGSSPTEFIFPAKIRNAADASIIIRRHSSSSFSSASGSPRVSVDSPEKQSDSTRLDEGSHTLRSMKRRHSQEDRMHIKRNKKKEQKCDTDIPSTTNEDKTTVVRPNKKTDPKRPDKGSKQVDSSASDENSSNVQSKVITRSNGAATGKVTSKSKKNVKSKVTFAKGNDIEQTEDLSKEEDELSACLAEAATALSIVSASNRSGNTTLNRKNKVNPNIAKILELAGNKAKTESRCQFSNKEINVRRHGYLVQLILTPSSSAKIRNALTLQVMQELRETLSILKRDDECRVVLLTSTGTSFCEGLELSTLLHGNKEERRLFAQEMADAVKDFIKSLATFNKPIVAGVQGAAIGLGVTMLPLFDLVIASDKATFSTPYGKLGQIAEGAAVFTLSHILGSAITSELLLCGRTLTASEALRAGLVTRVLWPDRFQAELIPSLKAMSEQSSQSMEATKALLRHSLRKKLDAALESETYLLIQHWCSAECQLAIKAYIDGKME